MPQSPKPRRKAKRKPSRLTATILLVAAVIAVAGYAFYRWRPQPTPLTATAKRPTARSSQAVPATPTHPAPPATSKPKPALTPVPKPIPAAAVTARFALVIDDMGYHKKIGDALLNLPLDLSFAFLPFAPHTQSQLKLAKAHGRDILLHLPMEPTDNKWDPGPGALTVAMDRESMHRTIIEDLAEIPEAIGINNHMGSRFTENEPAMHSFLEILKTRNLFFLDSQTSPNSVGLRVAKNLGVLTMHRNVFLDNQQDKDNIKKQLDALVFLAKKQGIAIGIAHPHQTTLEALRDYQRHHDEKVVLVSISSLFERLETGKKTKQKQ